MTFQNYPDGIKANFIRSRRIIGIKRKKVNKQFAVS